MKWQRLSSVKDDRLWRGTLFRFPVKGGSRDKVEEYMLYHSVSSRSEFALVVTSGYHSGHVLVNLRSEARWKSDKPEEEAFAISARWLFENWSRCIPVESSADDVAICRLRPAQRMPRLPSGAK